MSHHHPWQIWAAFLLTVTGLVLSTSLYELHVSDGQGRGGLASAVCGEDGGCQKVVLGRWGVLPPRERDEGDGGGISVAFLGMAYFALASAWLLGVGEPGRGRSLLRRAVVGCGLLGLTASLFFIAVMAFAVQTWCPLCLGTHGANVAAVALVFWSLRRRRQAATAPAEATPHARFPDAHRTMVTLVLASVTLTGAWAIAEQGGLRAGYEKRIAEYEELVQDGYPLREAYARIPKTLDDDRHLRPDDPTIDAHRGWRNTVVVFSDLECPSCANFDRDLFDRILPMFNGHLRVIFKHYPLTERHPNALEAAYAAEAARLQGEAKFWQLKEAIIENRHRLGEVNWANLAASVGLDAQRFLRDKQSLAVKKRVHEDRVIGKKLGVSSTPTVFFNGRKIDRVMRGTLRFWEDRAEALKNLRERDGQPWGDDADISP